MSRGNFVGLLSHRDLLSATISKLADIDAQTQDEIDEGIPISEIMKSDVHTVTPETELKDAAEILLKHKYGLPSGSGKQQAYRHLDRIRFPEAYRTTYGRLGKRPIGLSPYRLT